MSKPARKDFVGYFFRYRTKGAHAQAKRERGFAKQWRHENDLGYHKTNPRSLADMLMANEPGFELPLSSRERRTVSTVIQWLGSSVGFDFLNLALKRAGYRIEKVRAG